MTSFFRFVNKRASYPFGIFSLAHAAVNVIYSFFFLLFRTSCPSMYIDNVIIVQNETEIANCKLQFDQYGILGYKITSLICIYDLLGEVGCNFLAA